MNRLRNKTQKPIIKQVKSHFFVTLGVVGLNMRVYSHRIITVCLTLVSCVTPLAYSAEVDDRMTRMRQEEIQAKQAKADELAEKIANYQKRLDEDRKAAAKSQEKIWQDYTGSLEIERQKIKTQLTVLDEWQKAFEEELGRKRQQDAAALKSKEDDVKSMMLEMDRIRLELDQDRKAFEAHTKELKSRPASGPGMPAVESAPSPKGVEISGNGAVQLVDPAAMTGMNQRGQRTECFVEIGDVLDIDVWRVPDLSRSVTVRPDGRISMPVVGDVDVVGLSLIQIKDLLTQKFSEYVWNPQVSISIRQFGGRKFIILGEITGPGVYRFQSDLNLIEAIALAGGFREHSRSGKVMVIRGDIRKQPQVKIINANMENLLRKGMLTENIAIQPNDIIYVGKDTIANVNDVLKDVVNPFFNTALDYFVLHSASRDDHNS